MLIEFYPISLLLLVFTSIILIAILLKAGKRRIHLIWGLFNLSILFWGGGLFFAASTKDYNIALTYLRIAFSGAVFISIFFFHLTNFFYPFNKHIIRFAYFQGLVFLLLNIFVPKLFLPVAYKLFDSFYYLHLITISSLICALLWGVWIILGFWGLVKAYKLEKNLYQKLQIRYMLVGMIIGWSGGILYVMPFFKVEIFPWGNISIPIYSLIVTYAILRLHLLDIRVAFTRAGILLLVYVFILGFPFYFGFKTNHWVWSTIIMAVLASIGPLIYNFLRREAESILLSEQKQYQELLLQASRGMVREHNLNKLLELIVRLIKKSVKVSYAAAYIDDPENKTYVLKARREGSEDIQAEFTYDHPFIKYLKTKEMPFTYEEMPEDIKQSLSQPKAATPAVKHNEIGLVVSSAIDESPLGFLIMGHKLNGTLFTEDDINIFKIISNNAAVAVHNCLFTNDEIRKQETVLNIQKNKTISGMAAGAAHQFNNRLNAYVFAPDEMLELVRKLKEEKELLEKNPELLETLDTIAEMATKMSRNTEILADVVKGVLSVSKLEDEGLDELTEFGIRDIIDQSIRTVIGRHNIRDSEMFPVALDLAKEEIIYGDKQKLFECMDNCMDNAYEAIEEKLTLKTGGLSEEEKQVFKPEIKIKLIQEKNKSRIDISDNGIGMNEKVRERVFAPFYTSKPSSKKSHSGIGTYYLMKCIEYHKGKAGFESEYMKGTTFYIEIPRKAK